MNMKLKPIPALIALLISSCGGNNAAGPQGETASTQIADGAMIACVDSNHNWQCDDGDVSKLVQASGETGLSPSSSQYTLLETRDIHNRRTRLLVSEQGSGIASGLTTLRSTFRLAELSNDRIAKIEDLVTRGSITNSQLEAGYASILNNYTIALTGLEAYGMAVEAQGTASPIVPNFAPAAGNVSQFAQWSSDESASTRRQLSAQGSTVLNNSESNRLYLFDAEATTLATREIDLIPNDSPLLAKTPTWARPVLRGLATVVNVLVDTASAATGFTSTPSTGSAVVLTPGKGIAGVQLLNQGREALVLMNMLDGRFTADKCVDTAHGTEGLFRVALENNNSYRLLDEATACIHSGFSLVTSDSAGRHIAAWDAKGQKLWVLDGNNMQVFSVIELGLEADKPPQSLAISAGGRYLAAAGYGRVTMVDLEKGTIITQFEGSWGNVAQASFAAGTRRLLIASEQEVHSLALDNHLQLIEHTSTPLTTTAETLRALTVSEDGDSYVAVSDTTAYWNSSIQATGASGVLAKVSLPIGLAVQQAVVADQHLVVMARGAQDQQFKILRLPLALVSPLFAMH